MGSEIASDLEPTERETLALGWLSAELAMRSGAWDGEAPSWFPEPPEWLELWSRALLDTRVQRRRVTDDLWRVLDVALEAGERSHLLTVGSPARGLCLRVTLGRLDREGEWRAWWPDVFLIWRGRRL